MAIRMRIIAATFATLLALSVLGGGTALAGSGNANPNAANGQAHAAANCFDVIDTQSANDVAPDNGAHAGDAATNCDHFWAGP